MPGRTPTEAYFQFIDPIQKALNFIAVGRLLLGRERVELVTSSLINSSFNGGDLAPLTGADGGRLFLRAGCRTRVEEDASAQDRYQCRLVAYSYEFLADDYREVLAFHWNSNARGTERSYPHLHVGPAVSGSSTVLSTRFHKLHIPTGIIQMEAAVRFAIEELGVRIRPGMDRAKALAELDRAIEDR